jgi:hypothetical protein
VELEEEGGGLVDRRLVDFWVGQDRGRDSTLVRGCAYMRYSKRLWGCFVLWSSFFSGPVTSHITSSITITTAHGIWSHGHKPSRKFPEDIAPASAKLKRCALSSGDTRDAAVASLAQVFTPGSPDMVASSTHQNGAAWRRHGWGSVARRAAIGRRAILRGVSPPFIYVYVHVYVQHAHIACIYMFPHLSGLTFVIFESESDL